MSPFPFDIVGFDLDGTLFDTSADLTAALNHALGLLGRKPLSVAEVMPMVGLGTPHLLEQGLIATGGSMPGDFDRLYPALLTYYAAHIADGTQAYPGLIEALDALAARGVALAIVTNKPEALAAHLVGAMGLAGRFRTIIGGDTMGPGNGKPSAAPIVEMIRRCDGGRRAVFVGNSIHDVMAARNAGIPSVAVSFGFLAQSVETLGADAVIHQFGQLIPSLERLADRERQEDKR